MKQGATQNLLEIYFKERFSKKNLGVLSEANWTVDEKACRGGRDHLFLYLRIKGNVIEDIGFECGGCDTAMFVAGDILCELVRGKNFNEIENISKDEFIHFLAYEDEEGIKHFEIALKILKDGIKNYVNV